MPQKRNKKVDTSEKATAPKKGGKSKGGGGKRYDVIQKGATGGKTTIGTFQSQSAAQGEIERLVAESNNSLKLHDFEIEPSK